MPRISTKALKNRGKIEASGPEIESETVTEALEFPSTDDFSAPDEADDEESLPLSPPAASDVPTPRPPHFSFHSDNPRGRRPNDFFAYCCSIAPQFGNRLTLYVYLNWPVIAIMVPDKKRGGFKRSCQVAKLPGETPIGDEDDMLHRFGQGDYTLRLNDATLRKSIALCVIKGLRSEDHPTCQPKNLLDVLVYDDPANQSFIQDLRLRGILQEREREVDDMAQGQAVDRLASVIEKQFEMSKEKPAAPMQDSGDAAEKAVERTSTTLMKGVELGRQAANSEADAKIAIAKAEMAAGQQNPTQVLGFIKEVAEVLRGGQSSASPAQDLTGLVTALMARGDNMQTMMMTMLQKQIETLSAARAAPAQTAGESKPDDFMANLEKMIGMKKRLQEFLGVGSGGGSEDEPEREEKVPAWMQLAGEAFKVLPAIGMQAVAMTHNLAVARTGQGIPLGPGAMPAVEAAPGMEGIQPNPQPQSQPQGEPMNPIIFGMLKQIERPFLTFLNDPEKSGADFAEALMALHGRTGYDVIRERGKETVMGWLLAYPPIGQVISQIPERASQFVDDFMNADAILAAEQSEDEPGSAFVQGDTPE